MRTATEILEELENVLAKARPVPLTGQVRIEKDRVKDLLAELKQALETGRIA